MPAELEDEPELPPGGAHVWQWFIELAGARQSGFAPNPISFDQLGWWAWLTGRRPARWELRALGLIDSEWLRMISREQQEKQNAKGRR